MRKGTNSSGTFYRINLKNIPINEGENGTDVKPGIFERSGTDIQKFITRIEYIDGLMKDGADRTHYQVHLYRLDK